MIMLCQRLCLPTAWAVVFLLLLPALSAGEVKVPVETDFYRLKSLSFEEARAAAQPFLSPDGKLGYAAARNVLIIADHQKNIDRIKTVLKESDGTPANIRVEITFDNESGQGRLQAGVESGEVRVTRDPANRARIVNGRIAAGATAGTSREAGLTRQFVLAGNNRPARIWVGETTADPAWVSDYGVAHGWWRQELAWKDLGASLWVRPRVLSNGLIELEVYPRLTAPGHEDQSVDIRELSAKVIVGEGRQVPLGGLGEEQCQFYRQLFGPGRIFTGNRLAITLSASIMEIPSEMRKPE